MLDEPSNMLGELAQSADIFHAHSLWRTIYRFERHCMARRLPADLAGNLARRVSRCFLLNHRTCHPDQTLVYRSHDRAFLDNVAQDIIHQHSQRLDYYKGNFSQFYATKTERAKSLKKEYESQLQYRQHLQVSFANCESETAGTDVDSPFFRHSSIDGDTTPTELLKLNRRSRSWRSYQSSNRQKLKTPRLSSKDVVSYTLRPVLSSCLSRFPDPEKIAPPLLQLNEVSFAYTQGKEILHSVSIDVGLDSRIAVIGPNGAGMSGYKGAVVTQLIVNVPFG
jgi:ATPase subunit of ABC transporter with duplicated ATPase domains